MLKFNRVLSTYLCRMGEGGESTHLISLKAEQRVANRTLVIAKGFILRDENSVKYHMLSTQNLMDFNRK